MNQFIFTVRRVTARGPDMDSYLRVPCTAETVKLARAAVCRVYPEPEWRVNENPYEILKSHRRSGEIDASGEADTGLDSAHHIRDTY